MRRGNWVLYNDKPHIIVAVSDKLTLHEIAEDGTTVMEMNVKAGRMCDKLVVVLPSDVTFPCPEAKIPASRRRR